MSIFSDVWAWLKKEFTHITTDIDKVAITVTEEIKVIASNPEVGWMAKILDQLATHGIATEALALINTSIQKALMIELAIAVPSGPLSSDEFLAWEKRVMDALGVHPDQSVIWTRVSTTIIRDYQAATQDGTAVSFFEGAKMAQDAWLAYKGAE